MEEKGFYKIVEKNTSGLKERKQNELNRLSKDLEITYQKEKPFYRQFGFLASVAVCIILIAVFVPLSIILNVKPNESKIRFCYEEDYDIVVSEISISEYSKNNGTLFLDGELLESFKYVDKRTNETLSHRDYIYNDNLGVELYIYLVMPNIKMDFVEDNKDALTKHATVKDTNINYGTNSQIAIVYFEHDSYTYYLEFIGNYQEETLIAAINQMLN